MQAYKRRLRNALDNVFARYKNRAEKDKLSLQIYNPINQIYERRQRLIHIEDILNNQMTQAVERYRQKLSLAAYRLDNVSPLKKFDKGYSYVENNKQRVQSVNDTLDESFKKYKEGMELLNKCNTMLDKVEKQIVIIDDNGVVDNNE